MTFVKGQSGNPRGRPKGKDTIANELRTLLRKREGGTSGRARVARRLLRIIFESKDEQAVIKAMTLVMHYVDGRPPDQLQVDSKGQQKLLIEYVNDWRERFEQEENGG
jgi:hypothetical protein